MKKRTWISILILIIVIISLPMVDGLLFRKNYLELIDILNFEINQNRGGIFLQIENYHLGWFRSNAILKANFKDNELAALFPNGLIINEKIYHGPIAYDETRNRYVFAFATTRSKLLLPENIRTKFFKSPSEPEITVFTRVSFGKKWTQTYRISPITLTNAGTLQIADSKIVFRYKIKNNKISKFTEQGRLGKIMLVNNQKVILEIEPIKFSERLTLNKEDLYDKKSNFEIPKIFYTQSGIEFLINHLNIESIKGINAQKLFAAKVKVALNLFKTNINNNLTVSDLNFSFMLDNFNPAAMKNYLSYFRSHQNVAFTTPETNVLQSMLPDLLTPSSAVNLNLAFNSNLGTLDLVATLSLTTTQKALTFIDWLRQFKLTASLKLSEQMMQQLLASMIAKGQIGRANASDTNQMTDTDKINYFIRQWESNGYLVKDKDNYIMDINATADSITINGKTFNAQAATTLPPPATPAEGLPTKPVPLNH